MLVCWTVVSNVGTVTSVTPTLASAASKGALMLSSVSTVSAASSRPALPPSASDSCANVLKGCSRLPSGASTTSVAGSSVVTGVPPMK